MPTLILWWSPRSGGVAKTVVTMLVVLIFASGCAFPSEVHERSVQIVNDVGYDVTIQIRHHDGFAAGQAKVLEPGRTTGIQQESSLSAGEEATFHIDSFVSPEGYKFIIQDARKAGRQFRTVLSRLELDDLDWRLKVSALVGDGPPSPPGSGNEP
ncbi:MAG: hypothetical protein O3B84_04130 [Chloroflexi bacterium]|nr:hypothetical protein [Chloroflexota bacterium]